MLLPRALLDILSLKKKEQKSMHICVRKGRKQRVTHVFVYIFKRKIIEG